MTPLKRLVNKIHQNGLSQVATVLDMFIDGATEDQRIALQRSVAQWVVAEFSNITKGEKI